MVRVIHLAAADHGGAGVAAVRLHQALARAGAVSRMIVWSRSRSDEGITTPSPQSKFANLRRWFARAIVRCGTRRRFYFQDHSFDLTKHTDLIDQVSEFRPDLIVVHYIANYLSAVTIERMQSVTNAHVVWHLVDMASFTGGCHYAWECSRYQGGCGNCPALPISWLGDISARNLEQKERAVRGIAHAVVATSSTVFDQARASAIFQRSEIHKILIGVADADVPSYDAAYARRKLGIPLKRRVLFFGTQTLAEERKGMRTLLSALQILKSEFDSSEKLPLLLVAGNSTGLKQLDDAGFSIRSLGYVDSKTLALAYSAADFFVCPSLEDTGPMMINECIVAGTPVVAFRVGVAPDLIVSGENGVLAEEVTPSGLALALLDALSWDDARLRAARAICKEVAQIHCCPATQAEKFIQLAQGNLI